MFIKVMLIREKQKHFKLWERSFIFWGLIIKLKYHIVLKNSGVNGSY